MRMKVVIIGAGIGGLTLARALIQYNIEFEIYEAASSVKPLGSGITLSFNAMQICEELGISKRLVEKGHEILVGHISDEKMNPLSSLNFEKLRRHFGVPYLALTRSRLHEVLSDSLDVSFGKRFKGFESNKITFEDNTSAMGDVFVFADGIHSQGRQLLFPDARIIYSGQTSWRGLLKMKPSGMDAHTVAECWGQGLRFGVVPVAEKETYWFAVAEASKNVRQGAHANHKPELVKLFSGFDKRLLELIEQTEVENILRTDIEELSHLPKWYVENAVLLGDAAHASTPNLGQGAAQAIEDAYCLAKCLREGLGFQRYFELRFSKAKKIVDDSRRMGNMAQLKNPLGIIIRNFILKHVPKSAAEKQIERIGDIRYLKNIESKQIHLEPKKELKVEL